MYTNGNQASTTHKQFYTSDPSGWYSTRAIELREVGLTDSAYSTDQNYAPALGFHWGGITQAIMSLHTDGAFHFTSGGTSASNSYTNLIAGGFCKSDYNSASYILTSDGGATAINGLSVAQANLVRTDATGTNSATLLYSCMADNDFFRILVGGTASNAGFAEIATANDGNEPIYVRQYTGVFSSITRTLTLLDGNGNTIIPGSLNVSGNMTVAGTVYTNTGLRSRNICVETESDGSAG